jgi:hypothetical protein
MENLELLDLSHCKSNQEVCRLIRERVLQISAEDLILGLSSNFVYHEEAVKVIYVALAMNNNAILYGPGGYAKSEIVKAICTYLGIPLICKIGYQDMSPEELFGIPNMKNLLDNSTYETAFENSVFCIPGVLCIEEGMDLSPQTAASLKDIITEKGFREGSNKKDSLISSIIITGNKDPEDESINESIKAFYIERFPYRYNMIWKSHLESDYLNLFSVVYDKETYDDNFKKLLLVSKACESSNLQNTRISPRLAIYGSKVAISLGINYLNTLPAFDNSFLKLSLDKIQKEEQLQTESQFLGKISNEVTTIKNALFSSSFTTEQLFMRLNMLEAIKLKIYDMTFSDNAQSQILKLFTDIEQSIEVINKRLMPTDKINSYINNLFYK